MYYKCLKIRRSEMFKPKRDEVNGNSMILHKKRRRSIPTSPNKVWLLKYRGRYLGRGSK